MINKEIAEGITGAGPLQARLKLEPLTQIKLRPNAIFDLAYNKKVLHLGCTDHLEIIDAKFQRGILLHQQLSRIAAECLGVDINVPAVNHLRELGLTNVITADITQPGIGQISSCEWDFLLMAEMLEHIDNPVAFLKEIAANYKNNIRGVVITVPNAFGLVHMAGPLNDGIESVNNDHRYWFTPYTLCKVAHQAGLILDDLVMCAYESSLDVLRANRAMLLEKPVLLDTILLVAHWERGGAVC